MSLSRKFTTDPSSLCYNTYISTFKGTHVKLLKENFPVQIEGADSGTSDFKIAFNAKAFRVLSDTLYQDKIGSIVRETATNAIDSHVMAGKSDQAIEIHLPDSFEPWFSVKDFGVGLSKEAVFEIYTTYFMSTKDQSNDCTGMLGLGSKVSFAYTDQFTIESNFDGVKTIYSAFINGAGIPNIAEMHSEETTEGNGVEIKVAVKTEDFSRFRAAVAKQLKYFKVKPIILNSGYNNFEFEKVVQPNEQSIIGDGYIVTPGISALTVIQGQIGYEVDRNKITSACTVDDGAVRQLLNTALNIRLEFPIGEIGVTASRENIEYDKQTVRNIIDKLEAIRLEIQRTVEDKLQNSTCGWDKAVLLSEMFSHFKAAAELKYPNMQKNYRSEYQIDVRNMGYNMFFTTKSWRTNLSFTRSHVAQVIPKSNTAIMFVDIQKPHTEVINKIYKLNNEGPLYLVFVEKNADIAKIKKHISDWLLGFNNFYVHSEHVVKAVRQKSAVTNPKTTFFKIDSVGNFGRSYEQELPDDFVYVETSRGSCKEQSDNALITEFNTLKNLEEFADEMNLPLIGVPVSEIRKLKDSSGVPLAKFLKELKEDAPIDTITAKYRKGKLFDVACEILTSCDGQIRPAVINSGVEYGKMLAVAQKAISKYSGFREKYNPVVLNYLNINSTVNPTKYVEKALQLKSRHPILKVDGWQLRNLPESDMIALLQVTV